MFTTIKPITVYAGAVYNPVSSENWLKALCMMDMIGRSETFNRVLIVDNEVILGAGLEKLLAEETSLEVVGVTGMTETTLLQKIWQVRPDIVILIMESEVTTPGRLLDLLWDYGRLRIILVSVSTNIFEVYDRTLVSTNDQASFLEQLKDQ